MPRLKTDICFRNNITYFNIVIICIYSLKFYKYIYN